MHIKVTKLFLFVMFFINKIQKRATKHKTSRVGRYGLEGFTGLGLILSPEAKSSTTYSSKVSKASLIQIFTPPCRAPDIRCARRASSAVLSFQSSFLLSESISLVFRTIPSQYVASGDIPQKMLILQTVAWISHCPCSLNYHAVI